MLLLPLLLGLLSAIVLRADGAPGLATIKDPLPGVKIEKSFEERLKIEWKELQTEHTHDFEELIEFQTISADSSKAPEFKKAAGWWDGKLTHAHLERVKAFPTSGPAQTIYAEWMGRPGKPTVLVYGHYDVQPMPAKDRWAGPFEIKTVQESYFARGVAGGKGALLMAIQGIECTMRARLDDSGSLAEYNLPFNLKYLLDGQGEIGSPDLEAFLTEHKEMLQADLILSTVGGGAAAASAEGAGEVLPASTADQVAEEAWKDIFGAPPSWNRNPKATPAMAALQKVLGAPLTVFGWGLGDNAHLSNERLKLDKIEKCKEAWSRLMVRLGKRSVMDKVQAERREGGEDEL